MTRSIVLLAGLCIAGMPLAAHEGHAHKTMGVVTMIHDNHIEVADLKDKKTTFEIDAKTKITRGRITLRPADIKVGERVVVTYEQIKDKAGKVTILVKAIQVGVSTTPTKTT